MKSKKTHIHDRDLWRSLLAACVSRTASVRQAPVDGSEYREPYGVLTSWLKTEGTPPLTKIIAASKLLGCTERDVAMAVYGCDSQEQALASRKKDTALRTNAANRKKYATSEDIRLINSERVRVQTEQRRALVLSGPSFSRRWMVVAAHMKREGIITGSEVKFLKSITMARHLRSDRHKANRKREKEIARAKKLESCDYWLKKANDRLDRLLAQTRRMHKQLDRGAKTLNKPWHKAGYKTLDKWAKETPEGRMYQREHWQVVTHRRRAKQKRAGGRGVTREEWFAIMKKWDYHCAYCGARRYAPLLGGGKVKMTMDHVVAMPLGPDEPENILPACHSCNTSKAGNDLLVWAATKGMNIHPEAVRQYENLLDKYTDPTYATR